LRFVRDRLLNSLIESNKLFAPLAQRERLTLATRLRFLEVERGARLLEEGKSSNGFFILQAGNLVMSQGGKKIGALQPGDVFGDQALLDKAASTASVQAESKSFLLGLNPAEFADVMASHPRVLESVRALAKEREQRMEKT
jgi:CRP-like cAMP-binding protein